MKVVKAALSPMTWWLAARITWTMPIGSFGESVDWHVMQNDALAHVESEFSFLLPIPVASKSITWASFHVGFTIRGILCQVHDHMYCWEPLFPWYCADTELRIRHNLGWVRKVTCQRSLELGFQKVTLEFLGLIRKISHLPLGRSTCFEGYLWMWPRLEEHDYVSFIGKGSGLNIVCIYPTSYILTQPNSRILIFW